MYNIYAIILSLLFFPLTAHAADYWVTVSLADKIGNTRIETAGRSKRGDIVNVLPVSVHPVLSDTMKSEFGIIRVSDLTRADILRYKQVWEGDGRVQDIQAFRRYKLNLTSVPVVLGENAGTISRTVIDPFITEKTQLDLSYYHFQTLLYAMTKPIRDLWNSQIERKAWAGENISTVGTGKTYSTFTDWAAAKVGDITAGNSEVAECYGAISDGLVFSGWTTDSDSKIIIRAASGEGQDGIAGGSGCILTGDDSDDPLRFGANHIEVYGFEVNGNALNRDIIDVGSGAGGDFIMHHMILHNSVATPTTTIGYAVRFPATTGTGLVYDLIMFNTPRMFHATAANSNWTAHNITAYGASCAIGVLRLNINNSYIGNCTDNYHSSITGGDNNVSSDTDAPGSTVATSKSSYTDYFVDTASDFHLKATSLSLWGIGAQDLSGTFTTDIDNVTWGTWGIGADEYVAAGGRTRMLISLK